MALLQDEENPSVEIVMPTASSIPAHCDILSVPVEAKTALEYIRAETSTTENAPAPLPVTCDTDHCLSRKQPFSAGDAPDRQTLIIFNDQQIGHRARSQSQLPRCSIMIEHHAAKLINGMAGENPLDIARSEAIVICTSWSCRYERELDVTAG